MKLFNCAFIIAFLQLCIAADHSKIVSDDLDVPLKLPSSWSEELVSRDSSDTSMSLVEQETSSSLLRLSRSSAWAFIGQLIGNATAIILAAIVMGSDPGSPGSFSPTLLPISFLLYAGQSIYLLAIFLQPGVERLLNVILMALACKIYPLMIGLVCLLFGYDRVVAGITIGAASLEILISSLLIFTGYWPVSFSEIC